MLCLLAWPGVGKAEVRLLGSSLSVCSRGFSEMLCDARCMLLRGEVLPVLLWREP